VGIKRRGRNKVMSVMGHETDQKGGRGGEAKDRYREQEREEERWCLAVRLHAPDPSRLFGDAEIKYGLKRFSLRARGLARGVMVDGVAGPSRLLTEHQILIHLITAKVEELDEYRERARVIIG
jgi:hypothetical protein